LRIEDAETVYEDGAIGVSPSDESIAHGLRTLLDDVALRARLAHEGAEFVRANYSERAVSESLIREYESLRA
jgi:glycosyltransferase involved in cell wall biosynthesis